MNKTDGKPDPVDLDNEDYTATYCPEDNKLRLYCGRVERSTFEWLRGLGYTSTQKQDCQFVATWTPRREDAALAMIGEGDDIGDEDQGPADRAADRAERFAGYREKRRAEAGGLADWFDDAPSAYGSQNAGRAERQAARRDRVGARACSQWSKAEYWQTRTAGVISHALHKSDAATRRGRILRLEAEQRKHEASREEYAARYAAWSKVLTLDGADKPIITDEAGEMHATTAGKLAYTLANSGGCWGEYAHPRTGRESSLYSHLTDHADRITPAEAAALWLDGRSEPDGPSRWSDHYTLRLDYERAMLENEGGTAAAEEMQPGGLWKGGLITKVNKSNTTGAVVSVLVHCPADPGERYDYRRRGDSMMCNVQRDGEGHYTAPTPETLAKLAEVNGAKKERTQAKNAGAPKLINPTIESARELQADLNAIGKAKHDAQPSAKYAAAYEPTPVLTMTQAQYSAASKGTYSHFETRTIHASGGIIARRSSNMYSSEGSAYDKALGDALCKVRVRTAGGWYNPPHIVVITDKPQKPLPARVTTPVETVSTPVEV